MYNSIQHRIGNWVGTFKPHKVNAIYLSHITAVDENGVEQNSKQYNLEPIPLTFEILEKAGFKNKSQTTDYYFETTGLIIGGHQKKMFPCVWGESGLEPFGKELHYVHELQNLIFELTGQELTYTP